jgi:hypothetical protein
MIDILVTVESEISTKGADEQVQAAIKIQKPNHLLLLLLCSH